MFSSTVQVYKSTYKQHPLIIKPCMNSLSLYNQSYQYCCKFIISLFIWIVYIQILVKFPMLNWITVLKKGKSLLLQCPVLMPCSIIIEVLIHKHIIKSNLDSLWFFIQSKCYVCSHTHHIQSIHCSLGKLS